MGPAAGKYVTRDLVNDTAELAIGHRHRHPDR